MFGSLFGPPNIEKMQKKGDVDGLIKAMQYKKSSKDWPCWAPKALGILADRKAVLPLIEMLDYQIMNDGLVWQIVEALGLLKDDRAVEPLLMLAKKEFSGTGPEYSTLWALARLRSPQAIDLFIEIIISYKHHNYKVVETKARFARKALSLIGSPSVEPVLELFEKGKIEKYNVIEILEQINDKDNQARIALNDLNSDKEYFCQCIDENFPDIVAKHIEELKKYSEDQLIKLLLESKDIKEKAPWELGRRKSIRAVDALLISIHEYNTVNGRYYPQWYYYDERIESIIALGKINDHKAIEPIIGLFTDTGFFVDTNAWCFTTIEETLTKLGWGPH